MADNKWMNNKAEARGMFQALDHTIWAKHISQKLKPAVNKSPGLSFAISQNKPTTNRTGAENNITITNFLQQTLKYEQLYLQCGIFLLLY